MKKQNSYTVEWNKRNGKNDSIMVFDNNIEDDGIYFDFNVIAWFGFNDLPRYVLGKRLGEKNYPVLEDWQQAVEKRIGSVINWSELEPVGDLKSPTGGSITIVN